MKKTITLAVIAASSGVAFANPVIAPDLSQISTETSPHHHNMMTMNFSGVQFNDLLGSAANERFTISFSPFIIITGVSWDVNLTTIGASWASEATIDVDGHFSFNVANDDHPVTNQNYTSDGVFDFSENGIPDIQVFNQDFQIEFFDSFVDNTGSGDAFFGADSTITFHGKFLPTPSSLALFSIAGLASTRRRRQRN